MRSLRTFLLCLVLAATLAVSGAFAQSAAPEAPDYGDWARTALRAEGAVEAGRASDTALKGLRAELVNWRDQFSGAQSINSKTIAAVEAQIEALGPAPETGSEPEDIAAQRRDLNKRLAELQAPSKTAQVAFSRANVLISSIDGILRERQAEALLERGPTPLFPGNWARGWNTLSQSAINTKNEILNAWNNPTQNDVFHSRLPAVLALASFGLLLLLLGWSWMIRLTQVVLTDQVTPARWLAGFVMSLAQVLVPLLGLKAIVEAAYQTGLVGLRLDPILGEAITAGLMVLIAMWLGARVFPRGTALHRPLHLGPEKLREGRLVTGMMGAVLAVNLLMSELARYDGWSDTSRAVLFFPLIVFGGVLIWRLGVLLRMHGEEAQRLSIQADEPIRYVERLYRLLGRALAVLAFAAPFLAAAGYLRAAQMALFPLMESLLLFAFLLVVQRALAELYVLITRREDAREGLMPVAAGLILALIAAPRFALIWGVSQTQLDEIRIRVMEGFQLGGTRISPTVFLTFALVFAGGFMLTRLLQGTLKSSVLPKTKLDSGAQNALISGLGYVGIFLAALVAITTAGIDLSSLAIVAGALSVGIGFGLQNIVSNFVSGIILLIERPISEGDWIEVGGTHGTVRNISVRSTWIETFDRSDVILPNADLISGKVTNYTRGNTIGRVIVPVGVAYGTDTKRVEAILREIAEAHPMVLANPAPSVVFQGFGADSLDFEMRAILRDVNWILTVRTDMNHEIARRFAHEGIEIPFAQRDIWIRNPEALPGGSKPATPPVEPTPPTAPPVDHSQLDESDFDGDGDGR